MDEHHSKPKTDLGILLKTYCPKAVMDPRYCAANNTCASRRYLTTTIADSLKWTNIHQAFPELKDGLDSHLLQSGMDNIIEPKSQSIYR
jgi:hypothetical protein